MPASMTTPATRPSKPAQAVVRLLVLSLALTFSYWLAFALSAEFSLSPERWRLRLAPVQVVSIVVAHIPATCPRWRLKCTLLQHSPAWWPLRPSRHKPHRSPRQRQTELNSAPHRRSNWCAKDAGGVGTASTGGIVGAIGIGVAASRTGEGAFLPPG